ncbi:unnamed protein product [Prunus armeniaca]|uniref:Uncharacterized protein n=1 Tax=Prunus armeniaca TaxID=36596 RepID=A0A6J5VIY9_PRUAR|nr:unnamed protein product [Prunus armeniaca]
MGSLTKIPPILITTPAKISELLSQKNNKAEDIADGAAKSINFSSEDHDDVARIGKMRYDALIMEIKRLKIRLRWYQETLGNEKKKAKFHLRSVQIMKVRMRKQKHAKGLTCSASLQDVLFQATTGTRSP